MDLVITILVLITSINGLRLSTICHLFITINHMIHLKENSIKATFFITSTFSYGNKKNLKKKKLFKRMDAEDHIFKIL